MLTVGELPTELFARSADRVPCYTLTEAIALLGEDERLYNRFRAAAYAGFIHRRQQPNAKTTSPALFGIDDVAAAAVLFSVYDLGVNDRALAELTTRACYAWDDTINPRQATVPKGVSPIAAALIGASRGETWVFKLTTYHHVRTNDRRMFAGVFDWATEFPEPCDVLPPSYLPRATVSVYLSPLLLPLYRELRRAYA